jgi:predicted PhzF superfamily epimerase YddE/YHI9
VRKLSYFQVDAFTGELFRGNPAGVCLLNKEWLPDELMQRIACENNLSETAFVLPQEKYFELRWFTPAVEVDLCGHATLASAFVLFRQCGLTGGRVEFHSKSGPLIVTQKTAYLELDFPSRPGLATPPPPELIDGLGRVPKEILKARDWMAVFEVSEEVLAVKPKFELLAQVPGGKVIVTAPGKDVDFVSRFFAPGAGIDEDPVTGSAHCTLIPYWAARLGKKKLHGRQLSKRGGDLYCELRGDRVGIGGHAVLYSAGEIHL